MNAEGDLCKNDDAQGDGYQVKVGAKVMKELRFNKRLRESVCNDES